MKQTRNLDTVVWKEGGVGGGRSFSVETASDAEGCMALLRRTLGGRVQVCDDGESFAVQLNMMICSKGTVVL